IVIFSPSFSTLISSLSSPGRCTFCFKTLGNTLVFKSAEKIFEEIMFLITTYGIKQILFYDDTFTIHKKNVIRLCDMLINNHVDISWTCFARADYIDEEMLMKMKEAGCHQIMYGVENIDQTVLNNINKKINIAQVFNAVAWTKKARIECRLAFMVGSPGDTKEIIQENIAFINKINPDLVIINITTPLPGTAMFKWAQQHDLILTYNWDDYTLATPVMRLENLTAEQIKDLYKLMYRSFYLRPSYVMRKFLSIRSFADVKILLSGFKALLSFFDNKKSAKNKLAQK
ncbi:B12-binding domain-containing radical SAM protein, partial [Candidatus Omnitrophota bacterium]